MNLILYIYICSVANLTSVVNRGTNKSLSHVPNIHMIHIMNVVKKNHVHWMGHVSRSYLSHDSKRKLKIKVTKQ